MSFLESTLIAIALAADCFAVAFANGMAIKRVRIQIMLRMALYFSIFQAVMPLIGWWSTDAIVATWFQYNRYIAFLLLAFVGARMVKGSLSNDEPNCASGALCTRTLIILAIATSIDALFVGVSFSCMGLHDMKAITPVVLNIGIVAFLLTCIGFTLGAHIGQRLKYINIELIGGIILIALGIKILCE
ncbi:MAG: manganese efflux pump [Bacteroidaceae bacterium]|nr:manganese efflux pump [Bacteroidaceae bacterium]